VQQYTQKTLLISIAKLVKETQQSVTPKVSYLSFQGSPTSTTHIKHL